MKTGGVFVLGFILLVVGIGMVTASAFSSGSSVGGVIFIGPVPIVFGSGSNSTSLILIALVAAVAMIVVFYLSFASVRWGKANPEETTHKY